MNHRPHPHAQYTRLALGALSLGGFTFLYIAARLFGNDGIEYLFADIDRQAIHTAGHILVYGTLAVLLARALDQRYLLAWLVSNLLAAGEEWHQLVVPGRVACMEDAVLNAVSITAFLVLACWGQPLFKLCWHALWTRQPAPRPRRVTDALTTSNITLDHAMRSDRVIMLGAEIRTLE